MNRNGERVEGIPNQGGPKPVLSEKHVAPLW